MDCTCEGNKQSGHFFLDSISHAHCKGFCGFDGGLKQTMFASMGIIEEFIMKVPVMGVSSKSKLYLGVHGVPIALAKDMLERTRVPGPKPELLSYSLV